MSIARTDDRASARDSSALGGISIAAAAVLAIGAGLIKLRQRGDRRQPEQPLSDHLRRDVGLPVEPRQPGWWDHR